MPYVHPSLEVRMQLIGDRGNSSSNVRQNKEKLSKSLGQAPSKKSKTGQSTTKSCDPLRAIMGPHDCHDQFLITGKACQQATCTAQKDAVLEEANKLLKIKETGNGE